MENWMLSWGATILVTCGLAAYYTSTGKNNLQNTSRKVAEPPAPPQTASPPKRKQPKSVLRKGSANGSASLDDKPNNSKTHQKSASVSFSPNTAPGVGDEDDQGVDQRDANWALRLDANKKGVSLAPAQRDKPKKQSKKKSDAVRTADTIRTAGGVSDMLEATPAAPSAIRIVGEEKPKKMPQTKAAPEKESKKQRQNRKKQEDAKAQREADEQVRLKLLEQQRRTAREARGEPAKNGSASFDAKTGAWKSTGQRSDAENVSAATLPLLDTFEPASAAATSVNSSSVRNEASAATSNEQTNEWSQVPKGKKNKKKITGSNSGDALDTAATHSTLNSETGAASSGLSVTETNRFASISTKELISGKSRASSAANDIAAVEQATAIPSNARGHPQDSDWAA